MHHLESHIAAIASEQHGLITRAQLRELGVGDHLPSRRCRAGHWRTAAPGVFAIGGPPVTFHHRIMTAVLAAGPDALVSHRTALHLWGIRSLGAIPIEISVPRGRYHRRTGVVLHTSLDMDRADATVVDRIPATGLSRSLLDLGAVDPSRVRRAVWIARRTHELGWNDLLRTLVDHSRRGRAGVGPLRRVVAAHYGELAAESGTEDLAYALLVDSAHVPRPRKQVRVRCADGVTVSADLGWPDHRALVEIHGVDHFTNEDLQQVDLHRRNQLELAGYRLLVYSGRLLRQQPDQFVADVRTLLLCQGWQPGH